jgi:pimeloyl-ACP methyl ester carboxylesterase
MSGHAVVTPAPAFIPVKTNDDCLLELRHHPGPRGKAVLLVHGASAGSDTFRIAERQTLVDYLLSQGFDVWTLDWRASMHCGRRLYCANTSTDFTIDAAARNDVPAAIACMRDAPHHVEGAIGIVGHCMGGAIVAQGIAQGSIAAADVERVVLTGLGLFYKAAIDNILKAEDHSLEEVLSDGEHLLHPTKKWDPVCAHEPENGPWHRLLEVPYGIWLRTPLPHKCGDHFCRRLSYMFGMPYLPDNIPIIHRHHLPSQFGYVPIQLLLHCCQNLRRGWAAPYVPNSSRTTLPADREYLRREAFRERKLTLISGDLNSLWHRDSIDTMYEWLRRGRQSEQPRALRKHVLAGYGHQDIHWGSAAPRDVFPLIASGLSL